MICDDKRFTYVRKQTNSVKTDSGRQITILVKEAVGVGSTSSGSRTSCRNGRGDDTYAAAAGTKLIVTIGTETVIRQVIQLALMVSDDKRLTGRCGRTDQVDTGSGRQVAFLVYPAGTVTDTASGNSGADDCGSGSGYYKTVP